MRLAVRSTTVAICLALVALAPVAASARPILDPPVTINPPTGYATPAVHPNPDQQVIVVHHQAASPAVHPNPDQQVIVVHHQAASPKVLTPEKPSQLAAAELGKAHARNDSRLSGGYSTATFSGEVSGHPVSVQTTNSPSANPDTGFDWGDAAIGAAASLTLTLLIVGGAIVLSRRRSPQADSANIATT